MPRSHPSIINNYESHLSWSANTELVGLVFELAPKADVSIYPQYTIGLHAWFLDQVRAVDPELSAYLHDGESEKPFTISALDGKLVSSGKQLHLFASNTYHWYVTALSKRLVTWLAQWLKNPPTEVNLRNAPLQIKSYQITHAVTYAELLNSDHEDTIALQFLSPTSFRRKGHHLPLPMPTNVFHSYLRRWNDFSGIPVDQETFLAWVDEHVLITRHQLTSAKVLAGKKGAVTGFTGTVEFGLSKQAAKQPEFYKLFYALGKLAPYCGTGHKTTFGLGQTRLGWSLQATPEVPNVESLLAKRIEDLTDIFKAQRKRTGGVRAQEIAAKWATILARREMGESLQVIAQDMGIPYETVKTYAKLARRALANNSDSV
ncbi:CRISPR-associated endoribonuclease Cas6 [Fischerella major NIES-592]|uniref:CRISPR-associated endoribonuclease Cas6 n=2 Tax=Fischerella TaxID=1190 RepID=A0A1U7H599_9CYAN|nr:MULTISPECIES: CRISPR-associated endoribonuclease Cas6 [Fischerella]OKH16478.1 CRISPR-associated endoribonuclease Cas6 [Fischerella major NIES-592]PMB46153.1 CRISPR-associated endoribonuclease Cas6 [Fischerella thermalis CCMEE 5330]